MSLKNFPCVTAPIFDILEMKTYSNWIMPATVEECELQCALGVIDTCTVYLGCYNSPSGPDIFTYNWRHYKIVMFGAPRFFATYFSSDVLETFLKDITNSIEVHLYKRPDERFIYSEYNTFVIITKCMYPPDLIILRGPSNIWVDTQYPEGI